MSTFEVIRGVEGCCLALDDTRIAGPKPWGGGTVIHSWETDEDYGVLSGECEMAFGEDMLPECGNCGEPLVYYTKRHGFNSKDKRSASFCPRCGKAVKL